MHQLAAVVAGLIAAVFTALADAHLLAIGANRVVHEVFVHQLTAVLTGLVVVIPAVFTDPHLRTVLVDHAVHLIIQAIFIAIIADGIMLAQTVRADIPAIDALHHAVGVVFVAVVTACITPLQTTLADIPPMAVTVVDLVQIILVLHAFFAVIAVGHIVIFFAVIAVHLGADLIAALDAQAIGANFQRLRVFQMVEPDADPAVELVINPIRVAAKALPLIHIVRALVTDGAVHLPQIRLLLQHRNLALNQVTVQPTVFGSSVDAALGVVHPALKQDAVPRLVREHLPCGLPVIQRFTVFRVCHCEHEEANLIPCVAGAAAVVLVLGAVQRVAACQTRAAPVVLRIAHGQEVRGIDADEQLEPQLPAGQLVRKLSVQVLELAPFGLVSHAQRNTQGLEDAAPLLPRLVRFRRQLLDGLDTGLLRILIVRLTEERDGVHNQVHPLLVISCRQLCVAQNPVGQIIDPSVVGVVRPRPVDDERVQFRVPHRRLAEQLPQALFGVGAVPRQPLNELIGDVLQHIHLIGMCTVVFDRLPDVALGLSNDFLHFHVLCPPSIKSALSSSGWGGRSPSDAPDGAFRLLL